MKQSIVKIASAIWLVGLVLSPFMLSIPPARVPLFLGLACIATIPLLRGTRRFQLFGVAATVGSLMLAYWEHEAGLRETARRELMLQLIQQQNAIENSTTNANPSMHE